MRDPQEGGVFHATLQKGPEGPLRETWDGNRGTQRGLGELRGRSGRRPESKQKQSPTLRETAEPRTRKVTIKTAPQTGNLSLTHT